MKDSPGTIYTIQSRHLSVSGPAGSFDVYPAYKSLWLVEWADGRRQKMSRPNLVALLERSDFDTRMTPIDWAIDWVSSPA